MIYHNVHYFLKMKFDALASQLVPADVQDEIMII
jgi:hypothetical protein